jgi:hypothetical protein
LSQRGVFDAQLFRPSFNIMSFTFPGQNHIRAAIICLFLACCPSAVGRFVVARVVDSIDSQSLVVAGEHVGHEKVKVMPWSANADTPSAIVFVKGVCFFVASQVHVSPDDVQGVFCPLFRAISMSIPTDAPAAFCVPVDKRGSNGRYILSAVTQASPPDAISCVFCVTMKHGQSPEFHSSHVDDFRHGDMILYIIIQASWNYLTINALL